MIIIDSDNYAEHGIETMFFPGGEPHVKVPRLNREESLLFLKLRTWADVGFAALLMDAVWHQKMAPRVFIPYMPGARQDRTDGSAALTLAIMGDLLGRYSIRVFDPHSQETYHQIRVTQTFMPADLLSAPRSDIVGIIAPDVGAVDRAEHFRTRLYPNLPLICATKERDSSTGRLSNYQLPALPAAGTYLIIDDICDGGGTFNLLAEAFAKDPLASRCSLELMVSHGIFSKGLDAISPLISHITTTDSWCRLQSGGRLTVLPLDVLFNRIMGESGA